MANIVIGVTGGIAAFKTAQLVSNLKKKGHNVQVIMTLNATKFVGVETFQTLTKNKVYYDTFDSNYQYDVKHISIASIADVFCIVPCTANVLAKVANGIADDMLTTTFLACNCPKIICPAMNTNMLFNSITQDNIKKCQDYGMHILDSDTGLLACGDVGKGKLPEIDIIEEYIEDVISPKPLLGKKVLVTAGPTMESIDPVRFISNHSSGKMGYSIASVAKKWGAEVTLISGKSNLKVPYGVNCINIISALDMFNAVKNNMDNQDFIIKAAAVSDYTPVLVSDEKLKKSDDDLYIQLQRTDDILAYIGKHKANGQVVCGFAMETQNLVENAKEKLIKKNCDLIIANNVKEANAGFGVDTNVITLITKDELIKYECMSKNEVAKIILNKMLVLGGK